jgi:hypothetical protein
MQAKRQSFNPLENALIQHASLEHTQTRRSRRDTPQFSGFVTDLILPNEQSAAPRPQAFLVEQVPNWLLPTHYHQEHQFQVVVGGGGRMGANAIELLGVHYASPHSAYGPLVSGEEGLTYLTLRAVHDSGAWYLPDQREHLLLRIPKRHAHGAPAQRPADEALPHLATPLIQTLIEPDALGLAAWTVSLPAHGCLPNPGGEAPHGGRFYVVTRGSLVHGGESLQGLAVIWAGSHDFFELKAGAQGTELVIVQFPLAAQHSFIEAMQRPVRPPAQPAH